MNHWMKEAECLLRERAPLLTEAHARELADDLYRAWPEDPPQLAIAKFFHEVPRGWNTVPAKNQLATH